MKNTTKAVLVAMVILCIFAIATATAIKPTYLVKYPAMATGHEFTGGVSGRVTTSNQTIGLADAFVAIVNASNLTEMYDHVQTDSQGNYQFTAVNNTFNATSGLYDLRYQIYVNHSLFGEGYSNSLLVQENATATNNVIINPLPAHIKIYVERNNVVADGSDTVKVWAYVTDALNNPVSNGYKINFSINSVAGYTGYETGLYNPLSANGSLGSAGQVQNVVVNTNGGYANTTFGWVPEGNAGNNSTIRAAFESDWNINDTAKVFFQPSVVSWFGSVMDSYGKPYGGVKVTLHVMSGNSEVYNMSVTALPDQPYPGSYVFDNIILWENVTHAYATAQATIQDGVIITGASQNYTLNKSRTSSGFIVLHVPLPDAIKVTANPDTILVGGDTSIITAQLYLNGAPYKRSGVTIEFYGSNDTIGYLPAVKTNLSDTNGQAQILLTSNMTKGVVRVTAFAQVTVVSNLTGYADVNVVGWGTISGMVTDKNKNGVPNANVTLWKTIANESGVFNTERYASPENPQLTVSRPEVAAIGTYTYYRIPSGIYNVTAEKADAAGNNHMWFAIVNLTVGTATNNVAIPDLVISAPPTATPVTSPTATATVTVTPVPPTPTPTPAPGFEMVFALAGLLGVAYLIARKDN
jgi:PGF-CTERM protein